MHDPAEPGRVVVLDGEERPLSGRAVTIPEHGFALVLDDTGGERIVAEAGEFDDRVRKRRLIGEPNGATADASTDVSEPLVDERGENVAFALVERRSLVEIRLITVPHLSRVESSRTVTQIRRRAGQLLAKFSREELGPGHTLPYSVSVMNREGSSYVRRFRSGTRRNDGL
jgi:hypothetical protein